MTSTPEILEITDSQFESEVLQSKLPVLIDFWAPWCGPCKMLGPVIQEIAPDYAGKLKIIKVNVDDCQEAPGKYGIRGIPTLLIFKEGKVVATKVGALARPALQKFIDDNL